MTMPTVNQAGDIRDFFKGLFPQGLDWARSEPHWYYRRFEVPTIEDGVVRGSITLEEQPHLIYRITHGILGNCDDPQTSGLFRDDQYLISFKDQRRNYMEEPIPSALLFGSESHGSGNLPLLFPVVCAGTRSFLFEIRNMYARTLNPEATTYGVGICLHTLRDVGGSIEERIR